MKLIFKLICGGVFAILIFAAWIGRSGILDVERDRQAIPSVHLRELSEEFPGSTVDSFELKDASPSDTIDALNGLIINHSRNRRRLSVRWWQENEAPPPGTRWRTVSSEPLAAEDSGPAPAVFNLNLRKTYCFGAVEEVAAQAKCFLASEGRTVVLCPHARLEPGMVEQEHYLLESWDVLNQGGGFGRLPKLDAKQRTDVKAALDGMHLFSPEGEAYYEPADHKIVIRDYAWRVEYSANNYFQGGCTGIRRANSNRDRIRKNLQTLWYEYFDPVEGRFFVWRRNGGFSGAFSLTPSGLDAQPVPGIPGLEPIPMPGVTSGAVDESVPALPGIDPTKELEEPRDSPAASK